MAAQHVDIINENIPETRIFIAIFTKKSNRRQACNRPLRAAFRRGNPGLNCPGAWHRTRKIAMTSLFDRLRAETQDAWQDYVRHPFVEALGDGSLARGKFRSFLIQDYLFLIQYARAYALLAYKQQGSEAIRSALETALFLLTDEIPMHVAYCGQFGISEAEMAAAPESLELLAYTRYVLDVGQAGDALDLLVALAPCIAGYAEIGARLAAISPPDNPYREWIETYTGAAYRAAVAQAIAALDGLGQARGAAGRQQSLRHIFRTATRLEAGFWNTGWHHVG